MQQTKTNTKTLVNKNAVESAVILTAGAGKRVLPLTAAIPKALLPVGNKAAVQRVAEEAILAGATDIVVVVSANGGVQKHFEYLQKSDPAFSKISVRFAVQSVPDGSGAALLIAQKYLQDRPFFVLNCDDIFDKNACISLKNSFCKSTLLGTKRFSKAQATSLGVAKIENKRTVEIIEKPAACQLPPKVSALVGRYLFLPDIFDALHQTKYVGEELRLTDAINILAQNSDVFCVDLPCRRFDTGTIKNYFKAFSYFSKT